MSGGRLIHGWDEAWLDEPMALGDRIEAACLGSAAGQTLRGIAAVREELERADLTRAV
ncbi:hypothetical protein SPF06_07570 [Sinomonas sp. JGH33]|uniref:Uncharacterized protein n=1 Tax=Sinomonas terricola TaxID=3110330 RepID=A0ABU5T4I4_9MICC|nr:hypothetical protein [Sinomonas sp. JGH33]MEA5454577.1 hypothetical protein [Sinomonas sp. JGH33]